MPCTVRQNKGPSTSVLTEEEASHDESSTHEESEPKQEVYINHTYPNAPQTVYTIMYMPYIEGPKMDWTVNDMVYTLDSSKGNSNVRIFWNVNLLPSLNAKSVRRLLHGPATLEWINMYHVSWGYPKMT